jgi:hypothetical protein
MDRSSFVFYMSWGRMIRKLDKDTKCDLIDAMIDYESGKEPSFETATAEAIFESLQGTLDADGEKYENRVARAKKGAKKRWHESENDACEDLSIDKHMLNDACEDLSIDKHGVYDNEYVDVNNINVINSTSSAVQMVVEEYNKTSFPKVNKISEQRRKAIKARLKTFSLEEILKAFRMADASSFLHGNGDKNWVADFDWIMGVKSGGDQHLTRILEGHYSRDKSETARSGTTPKNKFINFQQRKTDYDSIVADKTAKRLQIPYNDTPE